jgi:uncharacterized protein
VREAVADGYKRLLSVNMETEIRLDLKKAADEEAIGVFAENLRELLLAAPLGPRRLLALDPGFRTGCKLVVLDEQGDLQHHDTIYPHTGGKGAAEAGRTVEELARRHKIQAVAIGNGTASRETERFVRRAWTCPEILRSSWSMNREPASTRPAPWLARNSPITTSRCVVPCPSAAA